MYDQNIHRKHFLTKLGALALSAVGLSKITRADEPSSGETEDSPKETPAIAAKKEPRAVEQSADRV